MDKNTQKFGDVRENTQPDEMAPEAFVYHYKRSERMDMPGAGSLGKVDNRSWFRRSKGNLILVIDIAIIAILFIIYNVVFRDDPSQIVLDSYRYELKAIEYDGEILTTLRITSLEERPPGSGGLLESRVFSRANGVDSVMDSTTDILPDGMDDSEVFRWNFPVPADWPDDWTGFFRSLRTRRKAMGDGSMPRILVGIRRLGESSVDDDVWDAILEAVPEPE